MYFAFDAAAMLMIGLLVRKLVRFVRRGPRRRTGRLARTRNIAFDWVVPIWREVWVPIVILVGLPLITGAAWLGNLITTDLGQFLLVVAGLLLATGVTRVTLAVRRRLRTADRPPGGRWRCGRLPEVLLTREG